MDDDPGCVSPGILIRVHLCPSVVSYLSVPLCLRGEIFLVGEDPVEIRVIRG